MPSGLTSQETRAFLDAITRRDSKLARINESQWTALSEVAHGVPRDLRQLTELLREGGEHSFDEVIRRFYLERERDRSWQSSSRERITDLSEEATTVLCLLAHFVSPVTAADLERVRSIGITGMAKALDTLVQRSLIVRDHTGKVSLVEDVGELLSEWWPQQIKDTGDLLQRYVFSLLVDNGGKQYQRYAVLDEQWVIIDASLSGFFKGPNDRLQAVCYDLNYFLDYTGRWDKSLALSRPAEHKALETNDFLQAGWRATDTGWIHLRRRQAPEVESCAERALAHFRRSQADDRAIGWATRLRAAAREFIDDYSAALAGYRETLKLWSSSPDERGDLAVALNDIARIERSTGNFEAADSHYREALQFATRLQDLERRTETLGNMASLALQRRDWQTARRLASESLAMAEKLGRLELIAFSHQWIAEASLNDSAEAALLHARHAAEIFDRLASPYAERAREIVSEHERRIP